MARRAHPTGRLWRRVASIIEAPSLAVLVVASSGCSSEPFADELAELGERRQQWEQAAIAAYDFTIRYETMFLFGTYEISVIDGMPVQADRVEDAEDFLEVPELPKTIDAIFEQLERELASGPFEAAIEFDGQYGFPVHVFADREEDSVDDELEFFIVGFVARE